MKRLPRLFLQFLFLASIVASSLSASTRSRGKKKVAMEVKDSNICEIKGMQAPMYCYCNNNELRNATDATCVILNPFTNSDPTWNNFDSQIYLQKLKFVVRTPNGLDYIPVQSLALLKNLQIITIQDASINVIPEYAFSNLPIITEINLSRNSISTLKVHAFANMKNLTIVYLNENRITEINRDVFVNLPSMKNLYLNENNINTLHDKAFKHLTSLKELDLSNNQIKVITADSFHGLTSLISLNLRGNLIAMIGDRTFIEMPSLTELELDQNEIKYITEKALDGMRNLKQLTLSENELVTLEPDFLAGAPAVYMLNLRDNKLKTMTFDNIKPIVTNLYNTTSHFYLSGNKLICDCKLAWIWGLRNETKNVKLRDSLEELTCFLESNNATLKMNNKEDLEWNEALENARNAEEYRSGNSRDGSIEDDDAYMGDEYESKDGYEDSSSNSDFQPKVQMVEGKLCYVKNLFELKLEELPCPEPSREDLMASEQPSSRHENARVGSSGSIWFSSSAALIRLHLSVLLYSLLPLLSVLFT
ncbi:connectin [Apis mellifera caucasica]|uniref:Connectin n=1 Tax=Apis mellifera TaxID=7460 RepID=A0A7M7GX98_APIME|nr:connectin [Apis mellifera]XP_006567415.1 connectin [Apis mellifera]KAG6801062.1 connectin [Apis mellifera caucasica]KAG9430895.1 connectin [Apis mellifera carnica]|eukprot:XP_001120061.2 connectin [Apis mellifera]